MFNFENSEIKNAMFGSVQGKKIYRGDNLVWENFKGFTFEGEKVKSYRIDCVSLPETDPTKFKNMWAIIDGVDRLIWRSDNLDTLKFDAAATRQWIIIYKPNKALGTYTTLDTGIELPDGTYTFKVELK